MHARGPNNVVLHMDPEDGIANFKDEIASKLYYEHIKGTRAERYWRLSVSKIRPEKS